MEYSVTVDAGSYDVVEVGYTHADESLKCPDRVYSGYGCSGYAQQVWNVFRWWIHPQHCCYVISENDDLEQTLSLHWKVLRCI